MQRRNISPTLTYVPSGAFDAYIEPTGERYEDGFKIVVNRSSPSARTRFSVAHEICHTFFYELVPEIKYSRHCSDPGEEHLCNFGAAEVLVPNELLAVDAAGQKPSLSYLESLSRKYAVTSECMFLRLRSLGFWNGALLFWHRMVNGTFALRKVYGDRKVNWEWSDSTLLADVWANKSERTFTGKKAVTFEHSDGTSGAQIVNYQIKRRKDSLICLWSRRTLGAARMPLLDGFR
jgi:hypothetical protein